MSSLFELAAGVTFAPLNESKEERIVRQKRELYIRKLARQKEAQPVDTGGKTLKAPLAYVLGLTKVPLLSTGVGTVTAKPIAATTAPQPVLGVAVGAAVGASRPIVVGRAAPVASSAAAAGLPEKLWPGHDGIPVGSPDPATLRAGQRIRVFHTRHERKKLIGEFFDGTVSERMPDGRVIVDYDDTDCGCHSLWKLTEAWQRLARATDRHSSWLTPSPG